MAELPNMKQGDLILLYPQQTKYVEGYIVFTFPFIRTYVRSSFSHVRGCQDQSFCVPLTDFIYIKHDDRYRSNLLLSAIPTPGPDLDLKVTDLEFFIQKSQSFCA